MKVPIAPVLWVVPLDASTLPCRPLDASTLPCRLLDALTLQGHIVGKQTPSPLDFAVLSSLALWDVDGLGYPAFEDGMHMRHVFCHLWCGLCYQTLELKVEPCTVQHV